MARVRSVSHLVIDTAVGLVMRLRGIWQSPGPPTSRYEKIREAAAAYHWDEPWFDEVEAAQQAAIAMGGHPNGTLGSFNPFYSLPLDRLIVHGLTTQDEVQQAMTLVRESPEDWYNHDIAKDMERLGHSDLEARTRSALFGLYLNRAPKDITRWMLPG